MNLSDLRIQYTSINERMNVSYNWWGTGNDAEVAQRVFDFDDWNTFTLAEYSPFYITNELFINFWWNPRKVSHFLACRGANMTTQIAFRVSWPTLRTVSRRCTT